MSKRSKNKGQTKEVGASESTGTVVPFRRVLRPLAQRKFAEPVLTMTLAAGKARAFITDYFEPPLDAHETTTRAKALALLVEYFAKRGVRFDVESNPLFSHAPCGEVDVEALLEAVETETINFLCQLSEAVEIYIDTAMDSFAELGKRHVFLYTHSPDDPGRWLVPVVVIADLKNNALSLDLPPPGSSTGIDARLGDLERLVATQHPAVWARWKSLPRE